VKAGVRPLDVRPLDSLQALEAGEDITAMSKSLLRMLDKIDRADFDRTGQLRIDFPSFVVSKALSTHFLETAIVSGQLTMVKMLIELGASLGLMDGESRSRTPLHLAVCCANSKICRYLLSQGADPSLRDSKGHSPPDLAILLGAPACLESILESDSALRIALRVNIIADVVCSLDFSHSSRLTKRLASRGTHSRTSQTHQPIFKPSLWDFTLEMPPTNARETDTNVAIDIVRTLLARGCDINAGIDTTAYTPLHLACANSRLGLVQFLVAEGADIHRPNEAGDTALLVALSCRYAVDIDIRIVETLVQAGADVNKTNSKVMKTPLAYAIDSEHWDVVELLRKHGAEERRS
jgi:ankyrin repeat protein